MKSPKLICLIISTSLASMSGCSSGISIPAETNVGEASPQFTKGEVSRVDIRGFVDLDGVPARKVGRIVVSAPGVGSFVGDPDVNAIHDDAPHRPATLEDIGRAITVLHNFGDGRGSVLAQRIATRTPSFSRMADESYSYKFVYLRKGEFFLPEVGSGRRSLYAEYVPEGSEVIPESEKTGQSVSVLVEAGSTEPEILIPPPPYALKP